MNIRKKVSFSRECSIEADFAAEKILEAIKLIVAAVDSTGMGPSYQNQRLFRKGYNGLLDVYDHLNSAYEQLTDLTGTNPVQPINYQVKSQSTLEK